MSQSHPVDFSSGGERFRVSLASLGIFSALLGAAVLAGWHAHIAALIQLRPTLAPMQYNSALCFLFAGAAFFAFARGRIRLAQIFGALVAVFSGLSGYEYLSGLDLGIDQFFFRAYIATQTSNPGRMSPATALCFFQIGAALFLTGTRRWATWRPMMIGSLGSVVLAICFIAMLGYAVGLPGTYGWHQLTRIALHTAAGLAVLGLGVFAIAWNSGRNEGERTPRWLPVPLGLAMLAASLIISQALASKQDQEIAQIIQARAKEVKLVLNVRMEGRILSLARMAHRWNFSGPPTREAWENDAGDYVKDSPDFQAMEWIDPGYLVRWVVPLKGNEAKLNRDLTREEERHKAVERARELRQPAMTPMVELFRGGLGFIVYAPVYNGTAFDGFITAVFKAQPLFDKFLPPAIAAGTSIVIYENGRRIYERNPGALPSEQNWTVDVPVDLQDTHWVARVFPTPEMTAQLQSKLPLFVALAGCVVAVMVAVTAWLTQAVSTRSREVAAVNDDLRAALTEVKTLGGLLPICYDCKRIRDDSGYWNRLEKYLTQHSNASFSHGLCPECAEKAFEAAGLEVPDSIHEAVQLKNYD